MNSATNLACAAPEERRPPSGQASPPRGETGGAVVTNAASTGIRIDRKRLKSLARRSDAPGLTYLAAWIGATGATGFLVWTALGTLYVWPAMFVLGVVMSGT